MAKVNQSLYSQLKAVIRSGDYTVSEVADTLDWLQVESTHKKVNLIADINQNLYPQLKAAVQSGDYSVREIADTLGWLRVELIRKRKQVLDQIKVSEVEGQEDWYDNTHHRRGDAPQLQ